MLSTLFYCFQVVSVNVAN